MGITSATSDIAADTKRGNGSVCAAQRPHDRPDRASRSTTGTRDGPLRPGPLIALSLGFFLVMLDVTVVTVAIPSIRRDLGTGPAELQWIVDGYSAVFAGLLLTGGELGDRLGHRRVFLAGLGLFAAASVACAGADTPILLISARLAQGAGAALLVPASLGLLAAAYPGRATRARAIGVWSGISGIAFASGPVVGGLLVSTLGWRSVFWLNPPLVAIAILVTLRQIPAAAPAAAAAGPTAKPDQAGRLLGIIGLIALAAALNQAGSSGWTSPVAVVAFGVSALALTLFVIVERRIETAFGAPTLASASTEITASTSAATTTAPATAAPSAIAVATSPRPRLPRRITPLLAPSLFHQPEFASAAAIGVLLNLGYYGMLYLATLYFQVERGYSALGTGLALLPSAGMAIGVAPLSGRLTARFGPLRPMAVALVLGAVGFLGWLAAGPHTAYPVLLFALIGTGLAVPLAVPAATAAIMEGAPPERSGVASAVFNVARQTGNAVGVALFGSLAAGAGRMIPGMHESAIAACAAYLLGALLALRVLLAARSR